MSGSTTIVQLLVGFAALGRSASLGNQDPHREAFEFNKLVTADTTSFTHS